ncbi:hypothetical protein Sste5346_003919 [Sporothrix stenoceras]|uniref:Sulfatase N-terminal domain-containing protein n=1 Tax=Sporothrix stenoceras TaxID=5173 RepID=A0ABR3ZCR5_9PEZI
MAAKKPNFLIIVADDLGFSDTGPYGSEIATPTLDRLAKEGLRMTDFHTASACSPTRAMLFSGTDSHIAGLGQMGEFIRKAPEQFKGRPGYEGYLNFRVAALSEILQDAGYHTMMTGKWHLGLTTELAPAARGFDACKAFLPGAGNHFNFEPQLDHEVPSFVKSDGFWMDNDRYLDRRTELPKDYYSSDYFGSSLVDFLDKRTEAEHEKPFFAYLAFTAPHWPLQAPTEVLDKYRGMYNDGPEQLRLRRLAQLKKLGLVPEDVTPAPLVAPTKDWQEMDDQERAESARKMEVYAAMVDRIDQNIARVVAKLEATGELDNTFILFMSDNGAEGSIMEALPMMRSTGLLDVIRDYYDNSLDNIGRGNSYTWYGPRWALAATAPSRGFKGWTTEGGIRCPCIVRYPPLTRSSNGGVAHNFTTVMDLLPTCLELAGVKHPGSTFRGREVVPVRGKSWVPFLAGNTEVVHNTETNVTGWELFGLRGIRRGDYKAVWMPPPRGAAKWELYNLATDPGETEDLADKETEVMERLMQDWEKYYAETGMFDVDMSKRGVSGI